jgi:protein subunit release factor A
MLRDEIDTAEAAIERLDEEIKVLLLPKDPNNDRNVIVEIRGAEDRDIGRSSCRADGRACRYCEYVERAPAEFSGKVYARVDEI